MNSNPSVASGWLPTNCLVAVIAVAVLCTLFGCDERHTDMGRAQVRDSAGIRIVENTSPLWEPQQVWRVSPEPAVSIGSDDLGPCGQLHDVTDAVRLSDGRIVIVNVGTQELRFYGDDGSCLAPVGGRGGGPGEFRSLVHMWLRGDRLFAFDEMPPRLVEFDLAGRFRHAVRLDATEGNAIPRVRGVFLDGSMLVLDGFGQSERSEGKYRSTITFLRYDSAGRTSNQLGTYPAREHFWLKHGPRVLPALFLFGRSTAFVAHGARLYVADNSTYEIRAYALDGVLETIIRRHHVPIEVEQGDVDAVIDSLMSTLRYPPSWEEMFRSQPTPATMPAFGWNNQELTPTIHTDDSSNVWVKEYDRPTEERFRWSVFDSQGRWLGIVHFPRALEPKHIGDDFVLGLWRDELDVEHVQLYRLSKP